MEIIQTIGVEKTYGQGDAKVLALRGIDLTINRGEFLAIVGTSGSGKSTLLYILGGLDQPTKGEVKVHGKNIEKLNDEALTIFRRRNIGFVSEIQFGSYVDGVGKYRCSDSIRWKKD